MTENFEEITSERLREIAATEQMWNNELRKYVASALDRLSTALIVVGILAPIVGIMANPSVLQQGNTFWLIMKFIAMVFGGVLSFGLHICGRWVLKRGLS
ncbi:hypothetical protein [Phyllobacterium sp. P30BS-XVII]|uniref:hypothetical protein n=1 Tax=Phyllobacterium sp. P30BS-XVII TaxID=2587046 RepID=UPI000DD7D934|nr:hypothetical protein [Phyllobacterium sp. P30BS-XVII]MBA8901051.1 hypothetical protein [Phyllobacterium sp. P30BS-XVII]